MLSLGEANEVTEFDDDVPTRDLWPTRGCSRCDGTSENAGSPDPVNVAIVEMIASAVKDKARVHSAWLDNFKGVLLGVAQAACEI